MNNKQKYTQQDLEDAYRVWASAPAHDRQNEWMFYLNIRDGVPHGTNEAKFNKRFQRNGKPFRENKLDASTWK